MYYVENGETWKLKSIAYCLLKAFSFRSLNATYRINVWEIGMGEETMTGQTSQTDIGTPNNFINRSTF